TRLGISGQTPTSGNRYGRQFGTPMINAHTLSGEAPFLPLAMCPISRRSWADILCQSRPSLERRTGAGHVGSVGGGHRNCDRTSCARDQYLIHRLSLSVNLLAATSSAWPTAPSAG